MANRPIFFPDLARVGVETRNFEFIWSAGFAKSQQQKNVEALHQAATRHHADLHILEVSSRSTLPLGEQLSAFHLMLTGPDGIARPVENHFQSSKVFADRGPFRELLSVSPLEAKRDPRLRINDKLIHFDWFGHRFPLEPKTQFYDWLYLEALAQNPHLIEEIQRFHAFTDIAFNPAKSINCQARTCALALSLINQGLPLDRPPSPEAAPRETPREPRQEDHPELFNFDSQF